VTEELLDDPEISPAIQKVRGERVAQGVRMDARTEAGGGGVPLHYQLNRALREPASTLVQE